MLNGMIRTGRLYEFVDEVIAMHNEEHKEKTMWDVWLHRVFDKSFNDFVDSLEGSGAAPTNEQTAAIVTESQNMLNNFKLE